jgi:phosphatidylglycerophosphate synthase
MVHPSISKSKVDLMSIQYTFLNNHGRAMADFVTLLRILIVVQIINLSLFLQHQFSYNTILLMILLGWITDVLDGKLARIDKSETISWFGRNERKIDLCLIGTAHLYISRFVVINEYLFNFMALSGLIAFVMMFFFGESEVFMQMIYITTICGFIIIKSILENQYIWIPTLIFIFSLIVYNWDDFRKKVLYFIYLGTKKLD